MGGIFKAYDIRGVVGEGLTPQIAYLIGRGLAHTVFQNGLPIVVSRDMRTHSPELATQLMRGLCEGGCNGETVPAVFHDEGERHRVGAGGGAKDHCAARRTGAGAKPA